MSEIANLKPEAIWRNFDALTQVPRPSGHLEKVQQFLLNWAKEHQVEAFLDPAGNIVMRKPATPGYENRKVVLLQAHMDMVPQKSPESTHNFETDPIETYIEDGWVHARGTTLGSDDGIGVAAIMGVMESSDLKHGPVEALITRDEETGMYGANDLPKGELHADILMNLDSELWGKFVIGSAGGIDVTSSLEYKPVANDQQKAVRVTLKGLRGGHSGLEINEGRANANKEMVRLVRKGTAATCATPSPSRLKWSWLCLPIRWKHSRISWRNSAPLSRMNTVASRRTSSSSSKTWRPPPNWCPRRYKTTSWTPSMPATTAWCA